MSFAPGPQETARMLCCSYPAHQTYKAGLLISFGWKAPIFLCMMAMVITIDPPLTFSLAAVLLPTIYGAWAIYLFCTAPSALTQSTSPTFSCSAKTYAWVQITIAASFAVFWTYILIAFSKRSGGGSGHMGILDSYFSGLLILIAILGFLIALLEFFVAQAILKAVDILSSPEYYQPAPNQDHTLS